MDGFKKEFMSIIREQNNKIEKYGNDFVDFEKGKLTGLLVNYEKQAAEIKALQIALDTSKKIEDATYYPTKVLIDKIVSIVIETIVFSILGLVLLNFRGIHIP